MLKDQPKVADPNNARWRSSVPPTSESISIGKGDCGSGLGDTSNFERPIGRKAEKAIRKNKATGIYPKWATFVKTILAPQTQKHKLFAVAQEACRKDVECAFGVLQARFAIVHGLARFFHLETLQKIMKACIILHNMIVKDEREDE